MSNVCFVFFVCVSFFLILQPYTVDAAYRPYTLLFSKPRSYHLLVMWPTFAGAGPGPVIMRERSFLFPEPSWFLHPAPFDWMDIKPETRLDAVRCDHFVFVPYF